MNVNAGELLPAELRLVVEVLPFEALPVDALPLLVLFDASAVPVVELCELLLETLPFGVLLTELVWVLSTVTVLFEPCPVSLIEALLARANPAPNVTVAIPIAVYFNNVVFDTKKSLP